MWLAPNGGYVGVGTNAPTDTLHVNGSFRLVDGTQTNGYVLKSDANGVASWQIPDGTGNTVFYVNTYFTGNTSATCITNIFASNINSCSPLHINNLNNGNVLISENGGNVYIGSVSAVTNTSTLYVGDASGNANITIRGGMGLLRSLSVDDNNDSASPGANFEVVGGAGYNSIGYGELRLLGGPGGDGGVVVVNGGLNVGLGYNYVHIQPYVNPGDGLPGRVGIGNVGLLDSLLTVEYPAGNGQFRLVTPYTPTGSGDISGNQGQIAWDEQYLYVKTIGNGWGRILLDFGF